MSGQDTAQDKPLDASPYKLERAKSRGTIWKSADLSTLAAILALLILVWGMGPVTAKSMKVFLAQGLSQLGAPLSGPDQATTVMSDGLHRAIAVISPALLVIVLTVGLVAWWQSGGVFSAHPLKPDWTRLNPANGLKRLFSVRLLYESGKNLFKLCSMAVVAYAAWRHALTDASRLGGAGAGVQVNEVIWSVGAMIAKLMAVLLAFAMVDLMFARWEFLRNMRMSRREQEDEHKNREGDPRIRRRMRELRAKHLKQTQAVSRVADADVLLTNPTHVAVALKYVHGKSLAPQVLAKGTGSLAAKMRDLAYQNKVPTVRNPTLARELYRMVDIDGYVPESHYGQVARILVWLQTQQSLLKKQVAGARNGQTAS